MPRKKKHTDAAIAVAEPLEPLKDERPAPELPRAEQEPPHTEVITHPERDPIRTHAEAVGGPTARSHAEAMDRPVFDPPPDGFFPSASRRDEGIRVLKNTVIRNGEKVSVVALQFARNRTPTRPEKDALEQIHEPTDAVADKEKFAYQPAIKAWTREGDPGDRLGENVIDATRKMNELADVRKADRERMSEAMGR